MSANWETKVWGQTRCIQMLPHAEVHELKIKAGGYCSIHRHTKYNQFHVMSGKLTVQFFGDDPEAGPLSNFLMDGSVASTVPPGLWHRFMAETDVHCIEIYWVRQIQAGDIERRTEGGMLPPVPEPEAEAKPQMYPPIPDA